MNRLDRLGLRIVSILGLAAYVYLIAFAIGPEIETRFFPIRADQTVAVIERNERRLCWSWTSNKLRPAVSDNIDVFLITPDGDRSVMAPFLRENGQPWRVSGARPPGPRMSELCILLPPHVKASDDLRVESTIFYRGWHELWHIKVAMPDVVSPGGAS